MKLNMSFITRKSSLMMTVLLGLTVSSTSGVNAQDREIRKPKEETRSVYLVKYWVGGEVRYGKNPFGKVVKISALKYMNSNPYICTPSGFGQKARCRAI